MSAAGNDDRRQAGACIRGHEEYSGDPEHDSGRQTPSAGFSDAGSKTGWYDDHGHESSGAVSAGQDHEGYAAFIMQ